MNKPTVPHVTKKDYLKLKEVQNLYKIINKYHLREQAYKKLLQLYIQFKKTQK